MGDGLLAEFGSSVDAVECAVVLQREMAERNNGLAADQRIDVRMGLHLGDVIVEDEDRHGDAVNIAARLQQLAEPGGLCVSRQVAEDVKQKVALRFEPRGEERLKNIAEPVAVYRVLVGAPMRSRLFIQRAAARGQRLTIAALVAVLLIVAGGAAAWYFLREHAPGGFPSIAVLPFDNLSGDPELDYLSDGVSEDIITLLSRFPDLAVVSRNSSFVYKGKSVDVRQVGQELGVDYVLEGSVQRQGAKVRITAQLIDARTNLHVWAEGYENEGSDPWALHDEVTEKVVASLTSERGQIRQAEYEQAWGKDTSDLEEYDY